MKKLKTKQLGPWCSFCAPKSTRAVYKANGLHDKFSCTSHKESLAAYEADTEKLEARMTEADFQSWHRL